MTAERVFAFLAGRLRGPVERHEAPALAGLSFLLHGALSGGLSLRTDHRGRGLAAALQRMELETGGDGEKPA